MSDSYPYKWKVDPDTGQLVPFGWVPSEKRWIRFQWAPQRGSQYAFLRAREFEALYEGTRGPGKTDALIMDYGQHVNQGFGAEWRGVIFRQTYKQLEDLINKTLKWFPRIFPEAKWNGSDKIWRFPEGEALLLRYMERPADYQNYHGHAYPFIAFEEMTTWPSDECYKLMMSCCRSTMPGMPRKYRGTTNPYGVGHNWVKQRFGLPVPPNHIIGKKIEYKFENPLTGEEVVLTRRAYHGDISENRILLHADPEYIAKIGEAARNEAERRAWLFGDWDVVAGGMFDDIWFEAKDYIIVPRFEVPKSWKITRSFDWGSAKPFSVGWWAESDGTDLTLPNGKVKSTVRGDLFRIAEWYGWDGKTPNEGSKMLAKDISKGIIEREKAMGFNTRRISGVADSAIFNSEDGHCIADEMAEDIRLDDGTVVSGIEWEPADKRPGSRKMGWEVMRSRMKATVPTGGPREAKGLFVCDSCEHWLRTVPTLPRSDKDLDDVDTDAEDHIGDENRYRIRWEQPITKSGRAKGMV